jgi:hypothetical protein
MRLWRSRLLKDPSAGSNTPGSEPTDSSARVAQRRTGRRRQLRNLALEKIANLLSYVPRFQVNEPGIRAHWTHNREHSLRSRGVDE